MLRSVMIPADFSVDFPYVLRFAEGLGTLGVKRSVLGHSIDAAGMEGPVIAAKMDKVREQIRDLACDLPDSGLEVEVRVVTGEPSEQLLGIATESHVDAVVVGTHGKSLLTKLLAGSISEDIITNSPVPTLSVRFDLLRSQSHPGDLARGFGRAVILPTDFSSASMRSLGALLDLPAKSVATVYMMHVLSGELSGLHLRKAEDGAEFQLRNMAAMAAEKGINARAVIRHGDPRRAVLQEANERRATGIVTGTRGPNALQEMALGSVSLTLVRQASCPVLIVP